MKGKQSLKQTRAKKGDARTEYEEVKQRCNLSLTPTAIASLDAFATQLNCSRSEFVERLARGDGEAIALLAKKNQGKQEGLGGFEKDQPKRKKGRSLQELRKILGTDKPS